MTDSTPTPECNGDDNCIECCPEVEVSMPGTLAALRAERDELRDALSKSRRSHDFTRQWYAVRIERIRDLAKEHGIWPEAACILANGTADSSEPPTYAQILNGERHKRTRAEAERDRYRAALEWMADHGSYFNNPYGERARAALNGSDDE